MSNSDERKDSVPKIFLVLPLCIGLWSAIFYFLEKSPTESTIESQTENNSRSTTDTIEVKTYDELPTREELAIGDWVYLPRYAPLSDENTDAMRTVGRFTPDGAGGTEYSASLSVNCSYQLSLRLESPESKPSVRFRYQTMPNRAPTLGMTLTMSSVRFFDKIAYILEGHLLEKSRPGGSEITFLPIRDEAPVPDFDYRKAVLGEEAQTAFFRDSTGLLIRNMTRADTLTMQTYIVIDDKEPVAQEISFSMKGFDKAWKNCSGSSLAEPRSNPQLRTAWTYENGSIFGKAAGGYKNTVAGLISVRCGSKPRIYIYHNGRYLDGTSGPLMNSTNPYFIKGRARYSIDQEYTSTILLESGGVVEQQGEGSLVNENYTGALLDDFLRGSLLHIEIPLRSYVARDKRTYTYTLDGFKEAYDKCPSEKEAA